MVNQKISRFDASIVSYQLEQDQAIHCDRVSVLHSCIRPNYFPEHSNPQVKIAIPLQPASIQATWQTANGRQQRQQIKFGHVCIIPATQPREILWQREAELLSIYLELHLIEQIAAEAKLKTTEIVEQWTARDPFIQQLGFALRTELQSGGAGRLYVESMANLLAIHLLRNYSTTHSSVDQKDVALPKPGLQQAIAYIHTHLDRDISLDAIAQVVQMSSCHFARAFKQATGRSPHQYVLEHRIDRAKTLLAQSELSIADISYQLGFSSQSHFTRTFRQFVATTPKAYREAL